jgi:hypothetical protein
MDAQARQQVRQPYFIALKSRGFDLSRILSSISYGACENSATFLFACHNE